MYPVCKCRRPQINRNRATENAANVLLAVEKNKNISLRQIGRNFEIHHTTAQKKFKESKASLSFVQIC
jgi:hypothetical protein